MNQVLFVIAIAIKLQFTSLLKCKNIYYVTLQNPDYLWRINDNVNEW